MRRRKTGADSYGLLICACIGVATAILGSRSLAMISETFEAEDILYDEGPELFRKWLRREHRHDRLMPHSIARRLLIMPIGSRRATVAAMTRPDFLSPVIDSESERRMILFSLEDGILQALGSAPSAGDLWFAASHVRSRTTGFDRAAEGYLAASYLTAPREGELAQLRHIYLAEVAPMLRAPMTAQRDRDRTTIVTIYPRFEGSYREWQRNRQKGRSGQASRSSPVVQ